jgi:NADP-dependent 3-hydroxy acid dehydrogenase YdfG
VFTVNVKSVFHSVQAVVPVMKEHGGGSIINISSIGSVRPRPGELLVSSYNQLHFLLTNQVSYGTTAPRER